MKKFLSVVLTLMMVFSVFTTVSAATVRDYVNSVFTNKDENTEPFFQIGTIDPNDNEEHMPIIITSSVTSAPLVSGGVAADFSATLNMEKVREFFKNSDFIKFYLSDGADHYDSDAEEEFDRAMVTTTIEVTITHPGVTVDNPGSAGSLTDDNNGFFVETGRVENPGNIKVKFEQVNPIKVSVLRSSLNEENGHLSDLTFELNDVAKYTKVGNYKLEITMSATSTVTFDNQTTSDETDDLELTIGYEGYGFHEATIYSPSSGGGTTRYALTYETDGGSAIDKETYTRNSTVKLTKVPKKEGYIFEGWYLDKELTQKVTEVKMTKNTTVYAAWVEDNGIAGGGYDTPEKLNGDDHFAYIVGYPEGDVRPNNNITRAEVTTIFFRLLKENERNMNLAYENSFSDVEILDWYNTAVSTMAKLGIVNGRNAESFDPNAFITRAEFAAICARFADTAVEAENKFTDVAGHWAEKEIYEAAEYGWIRGYEDNTFRPDRFITRAEAMTMINRVLNRIPETANDLLDTMKKWSDNSDEAAWYYIPVQEATNSHDYDKKNHIYEKWTSLNENFDWTKYEQ